MVSDWVSVGGGGDVVCADANEYIVYASMTVCAKHPHMYYECLCACMYVYLCECMCVLSMCICARACM